MLTGKKETLDPSFYVSYAAPQQQLAMESLSSGATYPYGSSNHNRHGSTVRMRNGATGMKTELKMPLESLKQANDDYTASTMGHRKAMDQGRNFPAARLSSMEPIEK